MKKKLAITIGAILAATSILAGCGKSEANDTAAANTTDTATAKESTEQTTEDTQKASDANTSVDTTASEETEVRDYDGLVIRFGLSQTKFIDLAFYAGFFDKEFGDDGITYEFQQYTNGPAFLDAVAIDAVDIGSFGVQATITAVSNDVPVHAVANYGDTSRNNLIFVNPDSGIEKEEDLKGKTIAVSSGTASHFALIKLADYYGWKEGVDYQVSYISEYAEICTAVLTGSVDAGILNAANAYSAINEGAVVIGNTSEYAHDFSIILVNDKFTEKYPELVSRLIKVFDETEKWILENPEEATRILSENTELKQEDLLTNLENLDLRLTLTDLDIDTINGLGEFLYEEDIVTRIVTSDEWVDLKFLKELGIQ